MLKRTYQLYLLQFKHILKSHFILLIILIQILFLFGIGALFPLKRIFVPVFGLSTLIVSFLIYNTCFYNIKKSTIYSNLLLIKNEKFVSYISIFLIMCTVNLFIFILLFSIVIPFATVNAGWFFPIAFPWEIPLKGADATWYIDWSIVWWDVVIYYWFFSTVMTFMVLYLFQSITNSSKSFNLFFMSYFFIVLIFGGVLTAPDLIPAVEGNADSLIHQELLFGEDNYNPEKFQGFSWWFSQFVPHYYLNLFAHNSFNAATFKICEVETGIRTYHVMTDSNPWSWSVDQYYNAFLYVPWLYFVTLPVIGIFVSQLKK